MLGRESKSKPDQYSHHSAIPLFHLEILPAMVFWIYVKSYRFCTERLEELV
jgi:hypothetical protein